MTKELSIVGRGMIEADEPGVRPAGLRRDRGFGNGSRGCEFERPLVRVFQEETGLGSDSILAMTRTRKFECWTRALRIDANWERTVSGSVLRRRDTRLR